MAEDRGQKSEDREQKTEVRKQRAEIRRQRFLNWEAGRRKSEKKA
jgi:hypothetical protein